MLMKTIEIKADQFFEMLKLRDVSMWEIFAQMIDGEEKEIIFLNEDNTILFNYILPSNKEKLEEDRKEFSKQFSEKLANLNLFQEQNRPLFTFLKGEISMFWLLQLPHEHEGFLRPFLKLYDVIFEFPH